MKRKISIERLLRWRLKRAAAEAPSAPKAAELLKLARPWWEDHPARYHSLVNRLGKMPLDGGDAMREPDRIRDWNPVPALIVRGEQVAENYARVHEFGVQKERLCLRFQMEKSTASAEPAVEVTFISDATTRPLFCADGTVLSDRRYRVDTYLSAEIATDWEKLRLTDRMPFWLILCSGTHG